MKKFYMIAIAAAAALVLATVGVVAAVNAISAQAETGRELPIYSVQKDGKVAAITFDCAWGAADIPDILNTLKTENIKATFFIVGDWASKYPAVVKSIADEGHDIANHSDSHADLSKLSGDNIRKELKDCTELLKGITKKDVNLFRAPYGAYNDLVVKTAREAGYFTIQWDVDSLDWMKDISEDEMLNRVAERTKSGSIILFHNDTKFTAKMLPTIIKRLKSNGFTFEPVSKLIYTQDFTIAHDGKQIPKQAN